MTLTRELAELVFAKSISDDDRRVAASLVLDAAANAVAGRGSGPGRIILDWARRESADTARRAFVTGALSHILETDDLHRGSVTHPGCVVVPAALAVARRQGSSGRDFLDAVIRGYEAMCRVGMAVGGAHYRIWHNTATCGPFGSAVAAGALTGLDTAGIVNALGNAGTQSAGLWEFIRTGAMSKHLHAGRAAEAGVVAADLAALGFTGAPAILEGEQGFFRAMCPDADPGAVVDDPDRPFEIGRTSIKPWPCCRHTHPAVDAALEISRALDGLAVREVEVFVYRAAADVCDRPEPLNSYDARFSLQHCIAAALDRGALSAADFDETARAKYRPLASRVRVKVDPRVDGRYPEHWGCRLEVADARDGRHVASRTDCLGDPELPLDDERLGRKAQELFVQGGLDTGRAAALAGRILSIGADRDPAGVFTELTTA